MRKTFAARLGDASETQGSVDPLGLQAIYVTFSCERNQAGLGVTGKYVNRDKLLKVPPPPPLEATVEPLYCEHFGTW